MRFSVMTLNLWGHDRWPERREAVVGLLRVRRPDVLALQEVRPDTIELVADTLPHHQHVVDGFVGWEREGNLFWDARRFELEGYGAEPIGQLEEDRRLFWVRLRPREEGAEPVVVANVHYSYPDHPDEWAGRRNPRLGQAERSVAVLQGLAGRGPCLIMGDMNDYRHPLRILVEGGFEHSRAALALPPVPTHPAFPTARDTPQVIDWQLHRGPIRPIATEVIEYFHGDLAPSDHRPLLTVYATDDP
jgi:endonuclease/exonuclease/phosphatase family metal-dependent hydrolase